MRVVVVVGELGATAVGEAISTAWHDAAPADELIVLQAADDGLAAVLEGAVLDGAGLDGAVLDGAGLALAVVADFDWQALRSSLVTAVAGAAVERGVPCVVLAGRVSVGRREASAIGVDAAYAVVEMAGASDGGDGGADTPSAAALAAVAKRVAHRWSR